MRRLERIPPLALALFLGGCQTAPLGGRALLEDRVAKLRPLGLRAPMRCLAFNQLTDPARARYQKMMSGEMLDARAQTYAFKISPTACDVIPLEADAVSGQARPILRVALCVLLRTHFYHSPFEGLDLAAANPAADAGTGRVRVRRGRGDGGGGERETLDLYLDPKRVGVESRAAAGAWFEAEYAERAGRWLPESIVERGEKTRIKLDRFVFTANRAASPAWLKGFDLSLGGEPGPGGSSEVIKQSRVELADCQLGEG